MMRLRVLLSVVLCLLVSSMGLAQDNQVDAIPTLVPPTPIPVTESGSNDALLSVSGVATIRENGVVRIGVRYNEPPFGELNIRGEVVGYDADLARLIAELWDVELELIPVTRHTGFGMLDSNEIDLLMAAQIHHRSLDARFEFSHTYHLSGQRMMVRAEDSGGTLIGMSGRRIGVAMASDGERAVNDWISRTGVPVNIQPYTTLDLAYVALMSGEVDGVVASRHRLIDISSAQRDLVAMLDERIELEPYAVIMRRSDIHLRNLVNRSLQYLYNDGELVKIHADHFPGMPELSESFVVWANIGDEAPDLGSIETNVVYPARYTGPQVITLAKIRVAMSSNTNGLVEQFNRNIIERMAMRWGVSVEYVSGDPLSLVSGGQADIAVGIAPDWNSVNFVDYTMPYLLHGDRLMVPVNGPYETFNDLRGRWVAVMSDDPGANERAQEWADSINARIQIYTTNANDAADAILRFDNADVVYGDSLKLQPHVSTRPTELKLTRTSSNKPRWYSQSYLAFAVPRNDIDFRHLVEYTLQEMIRDGSLANLTASVMPPEDMPRFEIWPGSRMFMGLSLGG